MKQPLCFLLAVILGCQPLTGCTTWSVQTRPPQEVVQDQHPAKVRVRLADETTLIVEKPNIVTDSLVIGEAKLTGWIHGHPSEQDSTSGLQDLPQLTILKPFGVPVSSITQTEVRKTSASKTLGLALVVLLGVVVVAGIAYAAECNRTDCYE